MHPPGAPAAEVSRQTWGPWSLGASGKVRTKPWMKDLQAQTRIPLFV